MRRKLLSILLVVSMLAVLFTGCGKKANESSQTDTSTVTPAADTPAATEAPVTESEPVTLKWAIWDKDLTPYWNDLKIAYEAANPNVTIEMTDLGSADYPTVIATELSGSGSDFDIVTIKDVPLLATLTSKNALEPLDSYISDAGVDLTQYSGIEQVRVNGSMYELPFRKDFWVLYYNKDIFDRAGVAYPTNDITFDQYDALARQLTDTTYGSQVYGAHYHTWRSAVELFSVLDGKHTILDGNYDFFKPYYEMVLSEEDDQVCRNYADLSAEGLHYSAAFSGGDIAMMNMGTWFISTMIAKLKSGEYDPALCGNWGMVKYPHAEGAAAGSTLGTFTGLSVTSVSKNKQAAFDFIKYASGAQGAKVLALSGNFPAMMNDEVFNIITGLDGFPADDASKEAMNVSNLYLEAPYSVHVAEINNILDMYHRSIMNREMSIDEGIAAMNTEVGKILNQ